LLNSPLIPNKCNLKPTYIFHYTPLGSNRFTVKGQAFEKNIFEDDDVDAIFEDDDFDDLSDVEHVHSCSTYFIDGLFDMNTFEAAGVDVNNSNSTQDIQTEDDEEDIFTVDDILV